MLSNSSKRVASKIKPTTQPRARSYSYNAASDYLKKKQKEDKIKAEKNQGNLVPEIKPMKGPILDDHPPVTETPLWKTIASGFSSFFGGQEVVHESQYQGPMSVPVTEEKKLGKRPERGDYGTMEEYDEAIAEWQTEAMGETGASIREKGWTYHVNDMPMEQLEKHGGFPAKGIETDLVAHKEDSANSFMREGSDNAANGMRVVNNESMKVFAVYPQGGMIDTVAELSKPGKKEVAFVLSEQGMAFAARQPMKRIRGWFNVKKMSEEGSAWALDGWVPNPEFDWEACGFNNAEEARLSPTS
jgi:hypothetical protein